MPAMDGKGDLRNRKGGRGSGGGKGSGGGRGRKGANAATQG